MLLDVQMPGLTGFEVARRLVRAGVDTQFVFVTAFDQHAIEAFEVNAVDYLLKPVEAGRLATAVERARRRIQSSARHCEARRSTPTDDGAAAAAAVRASGTPRAARGQGRRIGSCWSSRTRSSMPRSQDDVITVVTNSLSGTSNYRTLDELQARLDPAVFWRVHRSHLVNINKIKEIVPWFSRNYILKMRDGKGTEIPVSRSQTKRLREYLRL